MSLVIIGKLYKIGGDEENPTVIELEGWHVNSTEILKGLDDYLVTPKRVRIKFSGVKTFHYRFDSKKQAEVLLSDYLPQQIEQEDI